MNINLEDLYVVSYSYICEDGEIVTGDWVVVGRENALKMSEDEWNRFKNMDYAHVVTKPATFGWNNAIVDGVDVDPIFNQETECEDISRDDFWDDDDEYVLAD